MAKEQEAETPKNAVKIEDSGPCRKKICIEIPEQSVTAATDEQYGNLSKDAQVPGFRRGRAPRRLLEKRFGKEVVEQVKLKLLADASDSALKDNKLDSLHEPDIDFEKIELPESGPLKFEFEVEVRPEFKLPALEGIPVNKTKLEVNDDQIDREIEQLLKWSGVWTPRDNGAIEFEDQVIVDALLKVEGIEEEEKLDNVEIFARHNGFVGGIPVENLDELLIGAKPGQTKKTNVDVPKTYFREEYRGKKVDIEITIKDIKWLKPAEMNQDFLKRFVVEDENELREKIRDSLQGRLEQQARREMTEQVYEYMLDKTDFDLPLNIVADQATTLLQRQYADLIRRGLSREQIEEQMEKLQAGSDQQAKQQLKTFFIIDKIAEKFKIEVTEEELNGHIAQLAIQQRQRPERMREEMTRNGSLAQFRLQIREDKCIAKLLESAKITEVKARKKPKKADKKPEKAEKTTKKAEKTTKKAKKVTKKTVKKTASTEKKQPAKAKKAAKKKTTR